MKPQGASKPDADIAQAQEEPRNPPPAPRAPRRYGSNSLHPKTSSKPAAVYSSQMERPHPLQAPSEHTSKRKMEQDPVGTRKSG